MTLGLPFYGRDSRSGDWTTYEDLVQRHAPLAPSVDEVPAPPPDGGGRGRGGKKATATTIGFNGVATITEKTRRAARAKLGGVMIWEVGQDCRLAPVTHGDTTHVQTCPDRDASLLVAIANGIALERGAAAAEGGPGHSGEL